MRVILITFVISAAIFTAFSKDNNCIFRRDYFVATNKSYVTCWFDNVTYSPAYSLTYREEDVFTIKADICGVLTAAGYASDSFYNESDNMDDLVTQVKFNISKVSAIPNAVFKKFKNLQIFNASHVGLEEITRMSFNKGGNLEIILLYNNRLEKIINDSFIHTKNLRVLDLSHNKITTIEHFALSALSNLEELSLTNNDIKKIDSIIFQPLTQLKWIFLDRNWFRVVPSDLFSRVHKRLEGIYLNNNEIHEISPYLFDNLHKLRFLFLTANPCIDRNFLNHLIPDNAFIKFELRGCIKNYQKANHVGDEKYNITIATENTRKSVKQCKTDTEGLMESLKNLQTRHSKSG